MTPLPLQPGGALPGPQHRESRKANTFVLLAVFALVATTALFLFFNTVEQELHGVSRIEAQVRAHQLASNAIARLSSLVNQRAWEHRFWVEHASTLAAAGGTGCRLNPEDEDSYCFSHGDFPFLEDGPEFEKVAEYSGSIRDVGPRQYRVTLLIRYDRYVSHVVRDLAYGEGPLGPDNRASGTMHTIQGYPGLSPQQIDAFVEEARSQFYESPASAGDQAAAELLRSETRNRALLENFEALAQLDRLHPRLARLVEFRGPADKEPLREPLLTFVKKVKLALYILAQMKKLVVEDALRVGDASTEDVCPNFYNSTSRGSWEVLSVELPAIADLLNVDYSALECIARLRYQRRREGKCWRKKLLFVTITLPIRVSSDWLESNSSDLRYRYAGPVPPDPNNPPNPVPIQLLSGRPPARVSYGTPRPAPQPRDLAVGMGSDTFFGHSITNGGCNCGHFDHWTKCE